MEHGYRFDRAVISDRARLAREARERLEKAAPDLLEALKQHDEWLVANVPAVNRPAWLDKLRLDAIAKAEKGD